MLEENVDTKRVMRLSFRNFAFRDEDALVIIIGSRVSRHFGGKKLQEILHQHTPEFLGSLDDNSIRIDDNHVILLQQKRVTNWAIIIENGSCKNVGIRGFHNLQAKWRTDDSPVRADEPGMGLQHHSFGWRHCRICVSWCFYQFVERLFGFP